MRNINFSHRKSRSLWKELNTWSGEVFNLGVNNPQTSVKFFHHFPFIHGTRAASFTFLTALSSCHWAEGPPLSFAESVETERNSKCIDFQSTL